MNVRHYFESLGHEFEALKHRVRHLIADAHWQTDGEWKESVLRHVLRRHLPEDAIVGRGFVVDRDRASHQIDILIRDGTTPVLFRDGDLAIVTPDAVLGLIEVKARVNRHSFEEAVQRLCGDIGLVRLHANTRAFAAVFAYECEDLDPMRYLDAHPAAAESWNKRIDFCAIGPDRFHRYWNEDPLNPQRPYSSWHSYRLPQLARGYFIHNVVDSVSPESVFHNSEVWFPTPGKEPHRDGVVTAGWAAQAG